MTATRKMLRDGTHRGATPEETWQRLAPLLDAVGITRVADVTALDSVGVPTWQAVRPDSRSIAVSQGKGVSHELARISAVMESIELWHAERPPAPAARAPVAELREQLGYDLAALAGPAKSCLHDGVVLDWLPARTTDGDDTYVPVDFVDMDSRVVLEWAPPLFLPSSNGLASGNSFEEAALHGLCEVAEREALARLEAVPEAARPLLRTSSLPGQLAELLERFHAADNRVVVFDATHVNGLPCFRAEIWAQTMPVWLAGSGCHLDPAVALSRALTEAAQSRLTMISGTRCDLKDRWWDVIADSPAAPERELGAVALDFDPSSLAGDDLGGDLRVVSELLRQDTGAAPLLVDLTKAELGVPVAKAIVPTYRVTEG